MATTESTSFADHLKPTAASHVLEAKRAILELGEILELAAFAAEARRVLNDIGRAAELQPELDKSLSQWVEARNQRDTHEDTLPAVLDGVARRLRALVAVE